MGWNGDGIGIGAANTFRLSENNQDASLAAGKPPACGVPTGSLTHRAPPLCRSPPIRGALRMFRARCRELQITLPDQRTVSSPQGAEVTVARPRCPNMYVFLCKCARTMYEGDSNFCRPSLSLVPGSTRWPRPPLRVYLVVPPVRCGNFGPPINACSCLRDPRSSRATDRGSWW